MVRLSPQAFVRHAGGESLLWQRRTNARSVLPGAEPFLRPLRKEWREVGDVVADVAAAHGIEPKEADSSAFDALRGEYDGLLGFLAERGFLERREDSAEPVRTTRPDWSTPSDFFLRHERPAELHLDLAGSCTERCVHCYWPDHPARFLPVEVADKVLREFRAEQGLSVHLSGGECLLHPDFRTIASRAKELDLDVVVLSNLTECDESAVAFLARLDPQFVSASLYSADPAEHDAVTRRPGSWRETTNALRRLEEAGVPFRISVPVLRETADSLPALARYAAERGWPLLLDPGLLARSDHDCGNLAHAADPAQLKALFREHPDLFDGGGEAPATPAPDDRVCNAGRWRLFVSPDGDYYPCSGMHGWKIANARDVSAGEIWRGETLERLRALRLRDFPRCVPCEDRAFCKICPAANFNATGSLFEPHSGTCAVAAARRESSRAAPRGVKTEAGTGRLMP